MGAVGEQPFPAGSAILQWRSEAVLCCRGGVECRVLAPVPLLPALIGHGRWLFMAPLPPTHIQPSPLHSSTFLAGVLFLLLHLMLEYFLLLLHLFLDPYSCSFSWAPSSDSRSFSWAPSSYLCSNCMAGVNIVPRLFFTH